MPKQSPLPMLEVFEDTGRYVAFFSAVFFPLYPSHANSSLPLVSNHHMLNHIFENFYVRWYCLSNFLSDARHVCTPKQI